MNSDGDFRAKLLAALGGPWPLATDLRPRALAPPMQKDGYRLELVAYEVEPGEVVQAYLLLPDGVDAVHPAPAIAVWHQHNAEWHIGKSEPAGLAGVSLHHTGVALAREGYVVLCPDSLAFEDRQDPSGQLIGDDYERFEFLRLLVGGKSLAWKSILDMRRAIDFLCTRPEVDSERLGCYGNSMGSTHTWLVGPWEPRLKCLVGNCCLPTYEAIERTRLIHCFANFVPGLAQFGDTPDIAALIAPRPLLLNFGELDAGSPMPEVRQAIATIEQAYAAAGAGENFSAFVEPGVGHTLSPEMWERTRTWFARHLK